MAWLIHLLTPCLRPLSMLLQSRPVARINFEHVCGPPLKSGPSGSKKWTFWNSPLNPLQKPHFWPILWLKADLLADFGCLLRACYKGKQEGGIACLSWFHCDRYKNLIGLNNTPIRFFLNNKVSQMLNGLCDYKTGQIYPTMQLFVVFFNPVSIMHQICDILL